MLRYRKCIAILEAITLSLQHRLTTEARSSMPKDQMKKLGTKVFGC